MREERGRAQPNLRQLALAFGSTSQLAESGVVSVAHTHEDFWSLSAPTGFRSDYRGKFPLITPLRPQDNLIRHKTSRRLLFLFGKGRKEDKSSLIDVGTPLQSVFICPDGGLCLYKPGNCHIVSSTKGETTTLVRLKSSSEGGSLSYRFRLKS